MPGLNPSPEPARLFPTEAESGPPASAPGASLGPGAVVDRYAIEALIGQGGMARVYRVRHQQLGTVHALKVLDRASAEVQARVLREGRVQARLAHPNVVAVTDVIEVGGAPGLIMELVDGPSLSEWARRRRPPLAEALDLGRQVIVGVAAAHRAGLIHRDLKLSNVLLAPAGGRWEAKIADFGLVKLLEGAGERDAVPSTRSGLPMGTPGYMAPEQVLDAAHVDARADVFALGAVLYALLTGRPAFAGTDPDTLLRAVFEGRCRPVRELAPEVPIAVDALVLRCLAVDPALRPVDGSALLAAWDAALAPPPAPASVRRPRWRWWAGAAFAAALAVAASLLLARGDTVALAKLAPGPALDLALAPDGGTLTWSDGQDLWRWTAGRPPENLTADLDAPAHGPALAPGGTRIAYTSGGALTLAGPRGEAPVTVAEHGQDPVFSPDGRGLVYATGGSASELWHLDLGTARATPLLRALGPRQPAFSPDGRFLAFAGSEGGWAEPGLWVMPASGGEPRRLVEGAGLCPAWDGRFVWYLVPGGAEIALWRVPVDPAAGAASGPPERLAGIPAAAEPSLAVAGGRLALAGADLWLAERVP